MTSRYIRPVIAGNRSTHTTLHCHVCVALIIKGDAFFFIPSVSIGKRSIEVDRLTPSIADDGGKDLGMSEGMMHTGLFSCPLVIGTSGKKPLLHACLHCPDILY